MGRKLNALLGRNFKTSKFKTLLKLTVSRLAFLKNQRNSRCTHSRNDVAELLKLGPLERALLRADHVIREQNMMDVFDLIESYCHLLTERVILIENEKSCPDELKEAISSLIFAASRCGELTELNEVRIIFAMRYGKDFVASAVDLRNSCGVNPKMIQKMSTKLSSLEARIKVVQEIALENGLNVNIVEVPRQNTMEELGYNHSQTKGTRPMRENLNEAASVDADLDDLKYSEIDNSFEESMEAGRKYSDVASAAQAAFESAAYAAAAARAAVQLAKNDSDSDSPSPRGRKEFDGKPSEGSSRSRLGLKELHSRTGLPDDLGKNISEHIDNQGIKRSFEKIHPTETDSSESDDEMLEERKDHEVKLEFCESLHGVHGVHGENLKSPLGRSLSSSSSDSDGIVERNEEETKVNETEPLGKAIVFDESDHESKSGEGFNSSNLKHSEVGFYRNPGPVLSLSKEPDNWLPRGRGTDVETIRDAETAGVKVQSSHKKRSPKRSQASSYSPPKELNQKVHIELKKEPKLYGTNDTSQLENVGASSSSKLQGQGSSLEKETASDLPKRTLRRGSNFVSVRTRPGTKQ
ncbi:uncharacterized protein LOC18429063 isoform X2 [Amborella trichopoda]|uniref:IST1-like protein n=1 Tax=Amborella trichopoda TaxID=13333 RepID=W1NZ99_AMBTC|nr:uncharacterized protein LOC18429063 isoform X2 [Amborella trichopoda]ERN00988.1 hypothetical protein AMTR_s00002p00106850 [Amborella trichopoda]|eukprot:XP_006838419.1 uncharacterized protein LOC18429063 isoform X2 [Amborella trichopoda]